MRAQDKAQNPLTQKVSFLLGFQSLYFGNIEKVQKLRKMEKK